MFVLIKEKYSISFFRSFLSSLDKLLNTIGGGPCNWDQSLTSFLNSKRNTIYIFTFLKGI